MSDRLKSEVLDACVIQTVIYGRQTWHKTKHSFSANYTKTQNLGSCIPHLKILLFKYEKDAMNIEKKKLLKSHIPT